MSDAQPRLQTRQDVARHLQVSVDTITNMVHAGTLPAIIIPRGTRTTLRFDPADIAHALDRFKDPTRTNRYQPTPRTTNTTTGKDANPWQSPAAQRKQAPPASQ